MKRLAQLGLVYLGLLLLLGARTTVVLTSAADVSGVLPLANGGTGGTSYVKGEYATGCTGTVTSSSTSFAFAGFGSSTTACTGVTTAVSGTKIPTSGTVKNLFVNLSAAGKSGDKVQMLKNGSTTGAPTCTYGTGTSCSDVSTALSVAAGDVITVEYVSGASDGSANLAVSFELWN